MDILTAVSSGFAVALQPTHLLYCFIGVFLGTLIGVLPGIGPVGTMSLLLPVTFHAPTTSTLILLAGIYYGSMYGGSTASILVNVPGEAASVVTCLDGYQMMLRGRAGPALGIAAFGSFIAGTLSLIGLMLLAPPLADAAIRFGPPEYFSLMVMGLMILFILASGSVLKAISMGAVGVILATIGQDPVMGTPRFAFHIQELLDGVGLVPLIMGIYGISEVFLNIEKTVIAKVTRVSIKGLLPNVKDWRDSIKPILRGTGLGFALGILPGAGGIVSTFASYALEKKLSKHPERFGAGAIEGVAGPESANNAATGGAFIPLLALGIPCNVVMAMLLGALMIHGVRPSPFLMSEHPDLVWGLIASMYVGNGMLLLLNLPLIGMWVQILKIPPRVLYPFIILFCIIGVYSINMRAFDIGVMIFFGFAGYVIRKLNYEAAPLVLAFILTPILEINFRQALIYSKGNLGIFITRPISAVCLGLSAAILLSASFPWLKGRFLPKGNLDADA
jgi:putative tricarboxylic transport membrane protein